jgi:hypothetical protein
MNKVIATLKYCKLRVLFLIREIVREIDTYRLDHYQKQLQDFHRFRQHLSPDAAKKFQRDLVDEVSPNVDKKLDKFIREQASNTPPEAITE